MRNHAIHALCFTAILLLPSVRAVSAQVPTAFDDTSITPPNYKVPRFLEGSLDTIAAAHITLLDLITIEYRYSPDHIIGLTPEQRTTRFDVVAKIDPPGVADPVHNRYAQAFVVDTLLKNHFSMKAHEGMVDVTTEHLVVAPGGIKFTPEPAPAAPVRCPCPRTTRLPANHTKKEPRSMSGLAHQLSDQFHIEVTDNTGLQGNFTLDLSWVPKLDVTPQTVEQVLRTALETHLGLTFMPTHRQEKAFIVDYIEIPANVIWLPPNSDSAQTIHP